MQKYFYIDDMMYETGCMDNFSQKLDWIGSDEE